VPLLLILLHRSLLLVRLRNLLLLLEQDQFLCLSCMLTKLQMKKKMHH
jgi:hypothetical protein